MASRAASRVVSEIAPRDWCVVSTVVRRMSRALRRASLPAPRGASSVALCVLRRVASLIARCATRRAQCGALHDARRCKGTRRKTRQKRRIATRRDATCATTRTVTRDGAAQNATRRSAKQREKPHNTRKISTRCRRRRAEPRDATRYETMWRDTQDAIRNTRDASTRQHCTTQDESRHYTVRCEATRDATRDATRRHAAQRDT